MAEADGLSICWQDVGPAPIYPLVNLRRDVRPHGQYSLLVPLASRFGFVLSRFGPVLSQVFLARAADAVVVRFFP